MSLNPKLPDSGTDVSQASEGKNLEAGTDNSKQTIENVLVDGQEPTAEFLQKLRALEEAPPLSDEELERQALEHPGGDGDPTTPE